jgi:DNA-binding NarL/FixJ family response regulator
MSTNVRSGLEQTRVVLIGMPRMLREIVREVVWAEPDLAVVGEFNDQDAARQAIDAERATVVITALEEAPHIDFAHLLSEHPHLRVVSLSADGSESFLCELRPHEQMLGELSPQALVAVIRGAH